MLYCIRTSRLCVRCLLLTRLEKDNNKIVYPLNHALTFFSRSLFFASLFFSFETIIEDVSCVCFFLRRVFTRAAIVHLSHGSCSFAYTHTIWILCGVFFFWCVYSFIVVALFSMRDVGPFNFSCFIRRTVYWSKDVAFACFFLCVPWILLCCVFFLVGYIVVGFFLFCFCFSITFCPQVSYKRIYTTLYFLIYSIDDAYHCILTAPNDKYGM